MADNKQTEQVLRQGATKVPSGSGMAHGKKPWSGVNFEPVSNMTVYPDKDAPASIVFGTDRPADVSSGTGLWGGGAAIDIVVGRFASKPQPEGTTIPNSFSADAARIYISELTSIDLHFGLKGSLMPSGGTSGAHQLASGIGIKADGVRIIGRHGVKIVTGGAEIPGEVEKDSQKRKIGVAPPIELIAGNSDAVRRIPGGQFWAPETVNALQPILLGESTISGLDELADVIGHIWAALFNLSLLQVTSDAALAIDPVRPWVPSTLGIAIPQKISKVIASLYHAKTNMELWKQNYLEPSGYKYIASRNVRAT